MIHHSYVVYVEMADGGAVIDCDTFEQATEEYLRVSHCYQDAYVAIIGGYGRTIREYDGRNRASV